MTGACSSEREIKKKLGEAMKSLSHGHLRLHASYHIYVRVQNSRYTHVLDMILIHI